MRNSTKAAILAAWIDRVDEDLASCQATLAKLSRQGKAASAEYREQRRCERAWLNIQKSLEFVRNRYKLDSRLGQSTTIQEIKFLKELRLGISTLRFEQSNLLEHGKAEYQPEAVRALEHLERYLRLKLEIEESGQSLGLSDLSARFNLPQPMIDMMLTEYRDKFNPPPKRKVKA